MRALGAIVVLAVVSVASGTEDPVGVPPVIRTAGVFDALGGGGVGSAVAVDAAGSAYVTGFTGSTSDVQVFVAKFAPDGTLLYEIDFGGGSWESGDGIAVNAAGEAYVCGHTTSPDFPATAGSADGRVFVAKVAADGSKLLFLRVIAPDGGTPSGIAMDTSGDAYICGSVLGAFPTTEGTFQVTPAGKSDAFVAKIAGDGSEVRWATLLGGAGDDHARAVAVDAAGNPYVAGVTQSDPFPLPAGTTPGPNPDGDGFIVMLAPDGASVVHARRFGDVEVSGVAVDAAGAPHAVGTIPTFPSSIAGFPMGAVSAGSRSAFVAKVRPDWDGLAYFVLLPGGDTSGTGIAVGADGSAYVVGSYSARSRGAWGRRSTIQWFSLPRKGRRDVFAARLSPEGWRMPYATVVGGWNDDTATGMALAPDGSVVITGLTEPDPPFDQDLGGAPDTRGNVLFLRLASQDTWLSVGRAFASDGLGDRDAVSFVGTHGFREHAGFDSRLTDVNVTVGADGNTRSLRIPAGDRGWVARADGGVQWTSALSSSPRWTVAFGAGGGFRVRVDHAGFTEPISHPWTRVTLDIAIGAHRASYARIWQRVRRRPERWQPVFDWRQVLD